MVAVAVAERIDQEINIHPGRGPWFEQRRLLLGAFVLLGVVLTTAVAMIVMTTSHPASSTTATSSVGNLGSSAKALDGHTAPVSVPAGHVAPQASSSQLSAFPVGFVVPAGFVPTGSISVAPGTSTELVNVTFVGPGSMSSTTATLTASLRKNRWTVHQQPATPSLMSEMVSGDGWTGTLQVAPVGTGGNRSSFALQLQRCAGTCPS